MQRAVGRYVSNVAGGSRAAASRMITSRGAASALGRLLFEASGSGIREVARRLNLDALASRSLLEIYASLVDFICGEGGETEDAINRDAYLEAVDEIANMPDIDLERPSVETINLLIERFIAGTIDDRIVTAIATQIVTLPENAADSQAVQQDVRDFVLGRVQDAMAQVGRIFALDQIQLTIDNIYERALAILQTYADDQQ
ncbi:Qat anti-phage system associated protein QatB [Devosia sp.]|uniref:Qat anti-phage system associated protein QatB n=1 Tax=Devosia sp. TaxID=1871048 RepID=UPI00292DA3D2|nr:Qat anti-phage system associated protein QatB [Devosia sp.]